jgi:branched-subunit amino acid transport protein
VGGVSTAWAAVLLAGAGSYLLRVLPLLLVGRFAVSERVAALLRDAGIAALSGLLVTAVVGADAARSGAERLLLWLALLVAAGSALIGRGPTTVVLAGAGTYAVGALVLVSVAAL